MRKSRTIPPDPTVHVFPANRFQSHLSSAPFAVWDEIGAHLHAIRIKRAFVRRAISRTIAVRRSLVPLDRFGRRRVPARLEADFSSSTSKSSITIAMGR